jgi:hypothetical protein
MSLTEEMTYTAICETSEEVYVSVCVLNEKSSGRGIARVSSVTTALCNDNGFMQ